ncbi:MAG TPA: FMN-binding protein, partial [Nakamurella sp.]
ASPAAAATSAATTEAATSEAAAVSTSTYTDGTYTATGTYTSPGGTEEVTVTLTIADDVITAATAEGGATRPPSSQYQGEFVDNFAALIIGKDIDEVSLDKVAGSSLTSGGFNAAVETIKSDAQA